MMTQVVYTILLFFEGCTNFLILAVPKTMHSCSSVLESERSLTGLKDQTRSSSPFTMSSLPVFDMSDVHQPL